MVRTRTAELSAQVARLSCDVHADTTTSCHCRDGSWFAKSCTRFGSMAGGASLISSVRQKNVIASVCPSVCLSQLFAAAASGGFAAAGPAGRRYRSIATRPAPQQHGAGSVTFTADV